MNKSTAQQVARIEAALSAGLIDHATAAHSLTALHRAAPAKAQIELEATIARLGLSTYVERTNGALTAI